MEADDDADELFDEVDDADEERCITFAPPLVFMLLLLDADEEFFLFLPPPLLLPLLRLFMSCSLSRSFCSFDMDAPDSVVKSLPLRNTLCLLAK